MTSRRFQSLGHFHQHVFEGLNRNFAFMIVENLYKARHVCAFEVVWQKHIHVEVGNGVLFAF